MRNSFTERDAGRVEQAALPQNADLARIEFDPSLSGERGGLSRPHPASGPTVAGWVKISANSRYSTGVTLFNGADQFQITVAKDGTVSAALLPVAEAILTTAMPVSDDGWHFITCSYVERPGSAEGRVLELYVDGPARAVTTAHGHPS